MLLDTEKFWCCFTGRVRRTFVDVIVTEVLLHMSSKLKFATSPVIQLNVNPIALDEVIGSRTYSIEEIMIDVVVAQIDPKQASEILQEFATLLPLQRYNLDHMKRVRRSLVDRDILEILMCPVRCTDDIPAYLREKCKPDTTRITCVPKIKPMTRTEYEEWGREWPTMFRPNASDKERERGFTDVEMAQHSYFMSMVEADSKDVSAHWALVGGCANGLNLDIALEGGGIVVNPQNGMVCPHLFFRLTIQLRSMTNTHLRRLLIIFRFDFSRT